MSAPDPRLSAIDTPFRERAQAVLSALQSHFLEMPRGRGFCERADFEHGYEVLKHETDDGSDFSGEALLRAIASDPRAWLVLRAIAGMSPGEAAYLAVEESIAQGAPIVVDQTDIREIDARSRRGEQVLFDTPPRGKKQRAQSDLLRAIVPLLAEVMRRPAPTPAPDKIHRLDKIDTVAGQASIQEALELGTASYSELLYERVLGRPYASHRDSVSGIVGNLIEDAIADLCVRYRIDGRPTRAREKVPGFEQAPDFLIPTIEPEVVIEAKLTEDDGTARDKAARVQTLRQYEDERSKPRQIVSVIDGRGFGHRPADLNRMLRACDGHVYTLSELERMVAPGGVLEPFLDTA